MKRYIKCLFVVLFVFCISLDCFARADVNIRTNDNMRVPADVVVTDENRNDIMNTYSVNSSEKIYDFSNVLSEEEEKEIHKKLKDYSKHTKLDAVILITDNLLGYNISDYAYNFYDYNDFKNQGVIFVISTASDKPEIYMGNSGNSNDNIFKIYNDNMINSTLKYLYENSITKGNYYEACDNFVKIIFGFYNKNSGNYQVDDDGNIVKKIPIIEIFIIAVALTFIIMIFLVNKTLGKKKIIKNNIYKKLDLDTMRVKNKYDKVVNNVIK